MFLNATTISQTLAKRARRCLWVFLATRIHTVSRIYPMSFPKLCEATPNHPLTMGYIDTRTVVNNY